jgi:hypothetical protein
MKIEHAHIVDDDGKLSYSCSDFNNFRHNHLIDKGRIVPYKGHIHILPPNSTITSSHIMLTKEFYFRKLVKYFGLLMALLSALGMLVHRLMRPDMTQARWFIDFWYIWLFCFGFMLLGSILYFYGDWHIRPTPRTPDAGDSTH